MDFVNENAVNDSGVLREVYIAFWEIFLQQCDGEIERVPRLRPDYCQSKWQAVGRVWVKGLLDLGVMPLMLLKAFYVSVHTWYGFSRCGPTYYVLSQLPTSN